MLSTHSLQKLSAAYLIFMAGAAPVYAQQRDAAAGERGVRAGFERAGGAVAGGDRAAAGSARRARINPAQGGADAGGDGRFGSRDSAGGGSPSGKTFEPDTERSTLISKQAVVRRARREGDCRRPRAGQERFQGGAASQKGRCDSQPGY